MAAADATPNGTSTAVRVGQERPTGQRRRVVVLGAGIAGLVAAHELIGRGHDVVVLEAQHRVGGRILTLRSFAPGLYAEAGAMRLPRSHAMTIELCQRFGLPLRPFMTGNPRGIVHVGGVRGTWADAAADPRRFGFAVRADEAGVSPDERWQTALAPLRARLAADGPAAWDAILADHDDDSLEEFLLARGWSRGAIEEFAVLNFLESDLHSSFVEVLREEVGDYYDDMLEIPGGMDRLPVAMYEPIRGHVRFGTEVTAIDQDDHGVAVTITTGAGTEVVRGDAVICTLPFPVLRHIEVRPALSRDKQRAIRQLTYHASTKVVLQVRERVWETDDGITGGASVTDLPIRRVNYPTPDPEDARGVLLASYTWGQDALQWGAMDEAMRVREALEDVAVLHPRIPEVFEVGASHAWYGDRWARGAFALFAPGQQSDLHEAICRPEGRILFAGEHCSLQHAWIQGSIESALRAVDEVR
jgi:monoamine oxidase